MAGAVCTTAHLPFTGGLSVSRHRSQFNGTALTCVRARSVRAATVQRNRGAVQIVAFKFLKDLGFKKPAFLPDFGKNKRLATVNRFYGRVDESELREVMADDAVVYVETLDEPAKQYTKEEWIGLMRQVKAAAADFTWAPACEGSKDEEGFCIVRLMPSGHHTGQPFSVAGLPPVPPSGRHFCLDEEVAKVKVESGQVQEVRVLPTKNTGPLALYHAMAGEPSATG